MKTINIMREFTSVQWNVTYPVGCRVETIQVDVSDGVDSSVIWINCKEGASRLKPSCLDVNQLTLKVKLIKLVCLFCTSKVDVFPHI